MYSQPSFGGYQFDEEEKTKSDGTNPLLSALGVTALGSATAGGGIAAELNRRKNAGSQTPGADLKKDAKTAFEVLIGNSEFDRKLHSKADGVGPNIRTFSTDKKLDNEFLRLSKDASKNPLSQIAISLRDAFTPSGEDFIQAQRDINSRKGLNPEGPRSETALKRIPAFDAIRDLAEGTRIGFDKIEQEARKDRGINLLKANKAQAIGSTLGRLGSEGINNGLRGLWWLVNAPQAVADLSAESATYHPNKSGIYGSEFMLQEEAKNRGLIDGKGKPLTKDVTKDTINSDDIYSDPDPRKARIYQQLRAQEPQRKVKGPDNIYRRRRAGNNYSTLLALPAAYAINAGIGLTNVFGGGDGRKALLPSEEDPTKTSNVIAEVASKYLLGRQGDILPWEEFKKVRPDVTKDEYMRYKAYRYDKRTDLNIFDDGEINLFGGILKNDNDGIFGPEIMFLGKSMPYLTTLTPTAGAIGGAALGAALSNMGVLNQAGIEDRIAQADFDEARLRGGANVQNVLSADDMKKLEKIQGRRSRLENRDINLSRFMPGYKTKRMRTLNPIQAAMMGGVAGLVGSNIFGSELERRRREQKIAENSQRNHFNGMDAGL